MKPLIPMVLWGYRQISHRKLFSHSLILSLICNSDINPVVVEKMHKFGEGRKDLVLVHLGV